MRTSLPFFFSLVLGYSYLVIFFLVTVAVCLPVPLETGTARAFQRAREEGVGKTVMHQAYRSSIGEESFGSIESCNGAGYGNVKMVGG